MTNFKKQWLLQVENWTIPNFSKIPRERERGERGEREERERGEDRERREEREGREEARFELYQKWCLEWNETLLKNIQGHRVIVHELKEEAMWSDFQAEFALK